MHELFDKLTEAFNSKDDGLFKVLARMWVEEEKGNPFYPNSIEHNLFFKAKRYYQKWRMGGIDMRSAKRNMVDMIRQLMERKPSNPYPIVEEKPKEDAKVEEPKQEVKKQEEPEIIIEEPEISKEELKEDTQWLLFSMVNACNNKNEASYEMYVSHLMDMGTENPFKEGTEEYELFDTMQSCWTKVPSNKRRSYVVGKKLCELINNTELEPEKPKQTVLGVLPEEKKSWFKFLFPWKKEGESDDGTGTD